MLVDLDVNRDFVFRAPYNLSLDEIKLEDGDPELHDELTYLARYSDGEELPRILLAALILHKVRNAPINQCLHTAIIWERG